MPTLYWCPHQVLKATDAPGEKVCECSLMCTRNCQISFVYYPAVTYAATQHHGRLFLITCKRLKLLRKASRLQLIQNSMPSVAGWRQCDI